LHDSDTCGFDYDVVNHSELKIYIGGYSEKRLGSLEKLLDQYVNYGKEQVEDGGHGGVQGDRKTASVVTVLKERKLKA